MPFSISHADGITTIHLSGRITVEEIEDAAQAVANHPAFEAGGPRIWDARRVTEVLPDVEPDRAYRTTAEHAARHRGHHEGRAVVVAPPTLDRTVCEFIRWHLMVHPLALFDSMDEARAWVRGR